MGDITNPAPSHERSEFLFFIDAFFFRLQQEGRVAPL